jgi:hypothetical protein
VLEAAGLTASDVGAIEGLLPKLDALVQRKDARGQDKGKLVSQLDQSALALEAAFQHYRARTRAAVGMDSQALKSALSVLPRRSERRNAPPAPPIASTQPQTARPAPATASLK